METDQNIPQNTNPQSVQDLNSQLDELVDEAEKINQDISEANNRAAKEAEDLGIKIGESINKVEQSYSALDLTEKDAGDELDKLILQQSEDLASD